MEEEKVRIKTLEDGSKAILRPIGRYGCPVLEVRSIDSRGKITKIRYEQDNEKSK